MLPSIEELGTTECPNDMDTDIEDPNEDEHIQFWAMETVQPFIIKMTDGGPLGTNRQEYVNVCLEKYMDVFKQTYPEWSKITNKAGFIELLNHDKGKGLIDLHTSVYKCFEIMEKTEKKNKLRMT